MILYLVAHSMVRSFEVSAVPFGPPKWDRSRIVWYYTVISYRRICARLLLKKGLGSPEQAPGEMHDTRKREGYILLVLGYTQINLFV